MANPSGHIVSLGDEFTDGYPASGKSAVVQVDQIPECPRCAAGKGCGGGLLGQRSGTQQVAAIVPRQLDVRVGDPVSLELAPRNVLRAALLVYGLPLACAVVAALTAYSFDLGDGGAATAALGGLIFGLAAARSELNKSSCLKRLTPTVAPYVAE